jgi:hypothetical protein
MYMTHEPCESLLAANRIVLMLHSQVSELLGGLEIKQAFSHLHTDRINSMLETLATDLCNDNSMGQ